MTKLEARKKYKSLRMQLTEDEVNKYSRSVCMQLNGLVSNFQVLHVFFPIKRLKEIDLGDFINHCYAERKTVCTSVSDFKSTTMKTIKITENTDFQTNNWGIPEPVNGEKIENSKIQAVIIPLLYSDYKGNRIGYGKGFYDRFLAQCSESITKIGVNYFPPNEEITDALAHDIRIDQLIIPKTGL